MKRTLSLWALVLFLAACSGAGGGGSPPLSEACPSPAVFDHASCTFDDAGTLFGP